LPDEAEMKQRLDQELVGRGLVPTRSQAESYIKLGQVKVNDTIIEKAGWQVSDSDKITLVTDDRYVSRAALKLKSVTEKLQLNFKDKVVLDVGSSTGGFTDFALQHGAKKVIAVDVGTNQLHPSLRGDKRIELHEQTDIRDFKTNENLDLVVVDVSFISLREVLPAISKLMTQNSLLVAMVKPQFEAGAELKNKGIIKNEKIRRTVLQQIETWVQNLFVLMDKADSEVTGQKGNRERFLLLKKL